MQLEPIADDAYQGRGRKRRRLRKRRHGIEQHYPGYGWSYLRWYDTEKQRDQALDDLRKHQDGRLLLPRRFRAVNR